MPHLDSSYRGFSPLDQIPLKRGDRVKLPAGVRVVRPTAPPSLARETVLRRSQSIVIDHVTGGASTGDGHPVSDPAIVWPGTGGYWCEVTLPELVRAGVIEHQPLNTQTE